MARCLGEVGRFADGRAYGDEAWQIAEAVNRPYERLAVYTWMGILHVRQGTLHTAIQLFEQAVALSQETNIRNFYYISAVHLALAYALAGRAADARSVLGIGGGEPESAPNLLAWGEAYLRTGGVEEAHQLTQRALANARHRKSRAGRRGPCGCSARLPRGPTCPTLCPPPRTTGRPSPWPRRSACVRSRPTVSTGWAGSMPRWDGRSRPMLRCAALWSCSEPWR